MAEIEPSVLANSIMAKLYDILTNGDDTVPMSEDNFFSWCTPGIPVDPEDFNFLSQGLTGVVKQSALAAMALPAGEDGGGGAQPELTPELLEALRAQDTAKLYMQAENFARLVDFVPDMAVTTNEQFAALSVMNNEGSLSERYEYILRMSQVMESQLPEDVKQKIEDFRRLLVVTKIERDLITDAEVEVTVPSPLVEIYNKKLQFYEETALAYNMHRIDALTGSNAQAIHFWAINANILRNRVKSAMDDWTTTGHKNDYEKIAAFIDQVMLRDMALIKEEYRDDLEKARLTGLASGSDFFYTSLVPGNFIETSGWTGFEFSAMDYNRYQNSSYKLKRSASAGGGGFFGFFGSGGQSSHASGQEESHLKFSSDYFKLEFSICQVPIVRPWFKTSFLTGKLWRFDQNNPEAMSEMVSDGGNPPKGMIPAYPTSVICVKDLVLHMRHSNGLSDFMSRHEMSKASGGGFVTLGPFHLGGAHASSSSSGSRISNFHYDANSQTMTVPGVQVIGFKCHVLPKSPDPLDGIDHWI